VVVVKAIEQVSRIIFRRIINTRSASKRCFCDVPIIDGAVSFPFDTESVCNLNFKNLKARLFNCQVCHFHVQAVEVDSIKALIDCLSESSFADVLYTLRTMLGAHLVELSEQIVELTDRTRVTNKFNPIVAFSHRPVPALEFVNNFIEVPWESQDIGMLLLRKLYIDSKPGIFVSHFDFTAFFMLLRHDGRPIGKLPRRNLGKYKPVHFCSSKYETSLGGS